MISAGRLRFLARRLIASVIQDALGLRTAAWVDGQYFRCDVRSDSAQEQGYADGVAVMATYEVRCRWNTCVSIGLTASDRILVRGKLLRVRAIRNLEEADRVAVIDCEHIQ